MTFKTAHDETALIREIKMKLRILIVAVVFSILAGLGFAASLEEAFVNPPDTARPGVYWYFMDGNLSKEAMTKDLESMKEVGLGNLVYLEVMIGIPRGPIDFMSDQWQDHYKHAVREAERLGIDITLGSGPGWTGSGGPWVKPKGAMQHLLSSSVEVKGPAKYDAVLPLPKQHKTPWAKRETDYYQDIAVYAFPKANPVIADINEKALYDRYPYTSWHEGVKEYLPAPAKFDEPSANVIAPKDIKDITEYLDSEGRLKWDVPAGDWTIVRMTRRATCADTRPAPLPGRGLECSKFDKDALDHHFANYYDKLVEKVGKRNGPNGWTAVHIDSWEMGAQNWSKNFFAEFKKRRGYDAKPYLLAYSGRAVESLEKSERFLWDVRLTCQDLVLENHAGHLKKLGRNYGFELSIEPYDMSPTNDLDLGAVADVPMCEFWSDGMGYNSEFSCIESSSIAHTMGRPIVSAEAFTAGGSEEFRQYPWSMKNQGDWAFCMGVNRFVYHTFAHKPLGDEHRPGMTMGPYGVHWDRGQTWWPMVGAYHKYVSRCSHLLRQGVTVSDVLYLTPEGAPHVFKAPASALVKSEMKHYRDKKGYGFDGCSPNILKRAKVKNGRIEFPQGTSYSIMVLPEFETMTPQLVKRIERMVKAGATVVGPAPFKSPSLVGYPKCDNKVERVAKKLWGSLERPAQLTKRKYGKGTLYYGGSKPADGLYPEYAATASILKQMGIAEDFTSTGPIRYAHRKTKDRDIYFVSNTTKQPVATYCTFRVAGSMPQLWNLVTGQTRSLGQYVNKADSTTIPLKFHPYESYFVIFPKDVTGKRPVVAYRNNFPRVQSTTEIEGPWQVSFDPKWGGPAKITFDKLIDWTTHSDRGIKYYSGIATYTKTFDAVKPERSRVYLDLGTVHDMARVKVNGVDLGVVWCAPWRVDITDVVKGKGNLLEVEIANRWPNRMTGDRKDPDKNVRTVKWESGLLGGKEYKTGRYTFATGSGYGILLPSGLVGPVTVTVSR